VGGDLQQEVIPQSDVVAELWHRGFGQDQFYKFVQLGVGRATK